MKKRSMLLVAVGMAVFLAVAIATVVGVFLGPIILSMGLGFLSIYRDVYVKGKSGVPDRRRSKA